MSNFFSGILFLKKHYETMFYMSLKIRVKKQRKELGGTEGVNNFESQSYFVLNHALLLYHNEAYI